MNHRLLYILICFSLNGFANDPFDRTQRQQNKPQPIENKVQISTTKCTVEQQSIAQDIAFNRLKIIGIVQHKDHKQLLFNDDEKRVFSAVIGDLIAQEQVKLHQINKYDIQFTRRQQDCSTGDIFTVKF